MENLKILIVEDEPMIAESLAEMLELMDHTVLSVAESGEEAVMQLMDHEPDLMLLDIQLRGKMDGVELASGVAGCSASSGGRLRSVLAERP